MSGRDELVDPLSAHVQHGTRPSSLVAVGNGHGSITSSLPRRGGRDSEPRWKPSVFDFKTGRSGSTCPTCKGSGRIPKG